METTVNNGIKKRIRIKEHRKTGMIIPMIFLFIVMTVMVIYTTRLMYNAAVSNSNAVMEDRILTVSAMINNHLNTAENVLHVAADSVHHMLISGTTSARIYEFLVDETNNVAEQFDQNYTGIYGFIMGKYMDGLNWVPPEGYDPKSRDWFIEAMAADGSVVFTMPYIDAQTGNLIISACRMLPDRQSVIALDVQLKGIQAMMSELTLNGKGYGFVVSDDGMIIAHRDESRKGKNICETQGGSEFLDAIKEADFGSFSYLWDGELNTVYVNRVANGWNAVMVVSDHDLYSEVRSQRVIIIIICALIFLMISAIYYVGHRNEIKYNKEMEGMKLEEQKTAYERKMLEIEKDAANASNKAKSDFLANMSHEIRTPMNAIIGMDEMILREKVSDKVRKYALDIQSAGRTLLSIINDILDFSKIESGKMELVPVEYGFASVMNDVVNMTMKKAQDKGLTYDLKVSKDIPSVLRGDEIRVRQVMLNLINNAIKYTHEGTVSVDVSYDDAANMLQVIVSDTGIGIKNEDLGKLFGSFQRLEEDKNRNIEGTGLGLNITMRLVKMMDGTIGVSSKYGEGTKFTAVMRQEAVDRTPVGDFADNLSKMQEAGKEYKPALIAPEAKILVVDDNDMNLEVFEALLEDTGIRVTTAESGRESIEILRRQSFNMIFLDQMMPGMSGVQTLEIIKKEHLADDTAVIALTADAIVGARENYIREGFSDYLSKPVMYDALEEMLMKYLSPDLIRKEGSDKEEEDDKPVVIGISTSSDKLRALKERLGNSCKGVFVRDMDSAARFIDKNRN
ncbi:MAG: response regulator [Lachnospiraceae bacterium]|nr:response regulator [Lachnospiraceae bacterium]